MGFWDWFTGKPKSVEIVDRVWMNQEAKFRGLCQDVQKQIPASGVVLVVAHFPTTLDPLREALQRNGLTFQDQKSRLSKAAAIRAADAGSAVPILVQADALEPDEFPDPVAADLPLISIVVAERHFLPVWDESIARFARSLGRLCRLSFHVSLEDPLMQQFAGEWVGQILSKLGMIESEPIESAMVARRIQAAQSKFAKRVPHERHADSPEEWLRWNVPN